LSLRQRENRALATAVIAIIDTAGGKLWPRWLWLIGLEPQIRQRLACWLDTSGTAVGLDRGWLPGASHSGQAWMRRIWPCPAPKPYPWLET